MASIGFLIGGAVITCLVAYLKNQLIESVKDMIEQLKIYKELK